MTSQEDVEMAGNGAPESTREVPQATLDGPSEPAPASTPEMPDLDKIASIAQDLACKATIDARIEALTERINILVEHMKGMHKQVEGIYGKGWEDKYKMPLTIPKCHLLNDR